MTKSVRAGLAASALFPWKNNHPPLTPFWWLNDFVGISRLPPEVLEYFFRGVIRWMHRVKVRVIGIVFLPIIRSPSSPNNVHACHLLFLCFNSQMRSRASLRFDTLSSSCSFIPSLMHWRAIRRHCVPVGRRFRVESGFIICPIPHPLYRLSMPPAPSV